MSIVVPLLVFSILIIIHEFGHFIVAKKSGITVLEFAVGMGPKIYSVEKGETEYSIRAFPIGGFCRMLDLETSEGDPRGTFENASLIKRIAVVFAGPFMNFLLSFVLLLIINSMSFIANPVISEVVIDSPAMEAGLMPGDEFKEINGKNIMVYEDLSFYLSENTGEKIDVTYERDGEEFNTTITPKFDEKTNKYIIGFSPEVEAGIFADKPDSIETTSFSNLVKTSFGKMVFYVKITVYSFIKLFTFDVSMDQVAGPIGTVAIMGDLYETSLQESIFYAIENMVILGALISVNLGIINLFPIPAVDGGRLVFLFIEAIRGKPIDPRKEGFVHFLGFVLLMLLGIFIAFNDVVNLIK